MINTTITHLSLAATIQSPLLNKFGNLKMSSSLFSRFAAPIVRNPNTAFLSNTAFSKGLSAAIYVNRESFDGKTFNGNEGHIVRNDPTNDEDITIKKCSFNEIIVSDGSSAIILRSKFKLLLALSMTETTFTKCISGNNPGAIDASISQISVTKTCFSECKGYDSAATIRFVSRAGHELSFNYSTFRKSETSLVDSSPLSAAFFDGGLLYYCNCNASNNYIKPFAGDRVEGMSVYLGITCLSSRGSIVALDSTFENNEGIPSLAVVSITPFKYVSRLNFFNNKDTPELSEGLITVAYELTISESVIKGNYITSYVHVIENTKHSDEQYIVSFVDCKIDNVYPEPDEKNVFFIADKKQFNQKDAKTLELDHLNMGVCQGNVISSFGWGTLIIALIIILVIVLLVVAVLLYYTDGNLSRLLDKIKTKRKKIPDYEVGLADIQVAQEEE
jgi:hypothetical protein